MRGFKRFILHAVTISAIGIAGLGVASAAGALAVGACGAYGQAFGFRDLDGAQSSALEQCKAPGCRIVATLRQSCAALAVDVTNPCGVNGAGQSARLGLAQNSALQKCYRGGGKECVIRTFVCDGPGKG